METNVRNTDRNGTLAVVPGTDGGFSACSGV